MNEQQGFELHQALMALDEGSIAFGAIFADVDDIVDVVKKWLDKNKIAVVNIEHNGIVR
jgi:ABC-type branched-subunit amino acid transport system ATPase component